MAEHLPAILLVDDEEHSLAAMRMALEDDFECMTASDANQAEALMEENFVQVIFCDQRMPGRSGVTFLTEARARWPDTIRIIITGYTETSDMIAAINEGGIYQFVTKPWHPDQLLMIARNATDLFRLNRDHDRLSLEMRYLSRSVESNLENRRAALREGFGFEKVLREVNSPLNAVIEQARQFAAFDVPVLISGEAGTGKTDLARAIHYGSLRSDRPFYEINCTGLDDDLLEAELFGARPRAVPGLQSNRMGLIRKADRGTLFINGVCGLSTKMQLALLRVAREGLYRPVGNHEEMRSDLRLIWGTHHDLHSMVDAGTFRGDLYYAMSRVQLAVPPLRARRCDMRVLAEEYLFRAAGEHGKPVHGLSDDALEFLELYDWPGNMRELENEILRMLIFSQDRMLGPELISRHILQAGSSRAPRNPETEAVLAGTGTLKARIDEIETRILRETLTRLRWNKSRAADELGLSRVGLRAKIDRHGITEPARNGGARQEE